MAAAFVFGNGVSRLDVNIELCKNYGKIYGCNGMYREAYKPDVLVATDRPISEAIQMSGYPAENKFYTRRPLDGLGALTVPSNYFGYSSGPIAIALACMDRYKTVYLLGFDMGPGSNGKFNNVYADTEFYKRSSSTPTYTGNWVRQVVRLTQEFPKISFIRVQGSATAEIKELSAAKNLAHMPMTDFLNRINNTKEL
jgi:hypothetical protein